MAVHVRNTSFDVVDADNNHYIEINTEYGTTHESSFWNLNGKLIRLNNNNNSGFIGKGVDLKGKTLIIKSNAENNTPNPDDEPDRIFVSYQINDQIETKEVELYDESEEFDDYPTIKVLIEFK
jgi:hypothetical protein